MALGVGVMSMSAVSKPGASAALLELLKFARAPLAQRDAQGTDFVPVGFHLGSFATRERP